MDFDLELQKVADLYAAQGYRVVLRPGPGDLPTFAKDFRVDLVGKRGSEGVLVQVKQTREDMAADRDMPRYAEITSSQPGWRYDFVILQAEDPAARELSGAQEPSEAHLDQLLADADLLADQGHANPALIAAWAGLEAAMRRKLRSVGETASWASSPRQMLTELYSAGTFSAEELARLEQAVRWRNEIVHGFAPPRIDPGFLRFLVDMARRLLAESRTAGQAVEA
jgi:hypothetical protein